MDTHEILKQHDELIAELVNNTDQLKRVNISMDKRLRIMENIQAIFIPVMSVIGLASLIGLLMLLF